MGAGFPRISVIIPVYNEASILEQNIRAVDDILRRVGFSYEIVIAEDGSSDGSYGVARKLAGENKHIVVLHSDIRLGKGESFRRGFKASRGDVIVFLDADLPVKLDHIPRLLSLLDEGYDIVIGSRNIRGADVERTLLREVASRAYNLFVRLLFRDGIHDHQCGFKVFRREAIESVIYEVESKGFIFDTELLIRAKRKGLRVIEVPIVWREPEGRSSKVRIIRDGIRMGIELLRLRFRLWRS